MTSASTRSARLEVTADAAVTDMRLEVVVVPVSDVDRAKQFYLRLGWRLDADVSSGDDFHLVQLTPPGSDCSVQLGTGLTAATPGSAEAFHLVVTDVQAARDELAAKGVAISEVYHCATGFSCRYGDAETAGRVNGRAPEGQSYGSFASFSDPDGNGWVLQEVTTRLPGRVDPAGTRYVSTADLASALRRAAAAHGEHEQRTGHADANWPDWYADYLVREQSGQELPR